MPCRATSPRRSVHQGTRTQRARFSHIAPVQDVETVPSSNQTTRANVIPDSSTVDDVHTVAGGVASKSGSTGGTSV
jgi:hypothetical protein